MGNYTIFYMFENPRRGSQARNFTANVPKILDLKSSSEQIFSENWYWVPLTCQNSQSAQFTVLGYGRKRDRVKSLPCCGGVWIEWRVYSGPSELFVMIATADIYIGRHYLHISYSCNSAMSKVSIFCTAQVCILFCISRKDISTNTEFTVSIR